MNASTTRSTRPGPSKRKALGDDRAISLPSLVRIRAEAAPLCGTEAERVKIGDGMLARAVNILTLPTHGRAMKAVTAALLDRHELTGAEIGRITLMANEASAAPAPGAPDHGR